MEFDYKKDLAHLTGIVGVEASVTPVMKSDATSLQVSYGASRTAKSDFRSY